MESNTVSNAKVKRHPGGLQQKTLKVVNYSEVYNKMDQCQNAVPVTQHSSQPTGERENKRERGKTKTKTDRKGPLDRASQRANRVIIWSLPSDSAGGHSQA